MHDAISEDIRHAVKVELVKRRLTQGELAKRIGITPQHLSRMMQGERGNLPGAWKKVFDELDLELTIKPKPYKPEPLDDESRAWLDADLAAPLEPYEWGEVDPKTLGKLVRYEPNKGFVVEGGKDG